MRRAFTDEDVRDLHDALAAAQGAYEILPPEVDSFLERMAAKFPLKRATASARYRLRNSAVIKFGVDGDAYAEGADGDWRFLNRGDFEPIPDGPTVGAPVALIGYEISGGPIRNEEDLNRVLGDRWSR